MDPAKASDKRTVQNFRYKVLRKLKKIKLAWKDLNYTTAPGVLILLPSTPAIAPLNQGSYQASHPFPRPSAGRQRLRRAGLDLPPGLPTSRSAVRELDKLDQQAARRILAFLHGRVATLDDPRSIGEALKGSKLGEFWKYRVGDYRVIARIEDDALRVLVVRVGSRDKVYR